MEKIESDGLIVEFTIPKTKDVIDEILECQGLIKLQIEKRTAAEDLADKKNPKDAAKILGVCQAMEYELGDRLQNLLFKCAPALKDGFPDDAKISDCQEMLMRFAGKIMLLGDPVKNL